MQLQLVMNTDLLIISGQYQNKGATKWYGDVLRTADIWIPDMNRIAVEDRG